MLICISGGAKSGKSTWAEKLAVSLSGANHRYYIATMVPTDKEDEKRIKRHQTMRKDKQFQTIECSHNLSALTIDPKGTYLLDSVTALLSNVMFGEKVKKDCVSEVVEDLLSISCKNLILVFDWIYSDAIHYEELTKLYQKNLALIQREIQKKSDIVMECCAGTVIVHKGELSIPKEEEGQMDCIIGGAFQGKTAYVKEKYGLSDKDIFVCQNEIIDPSKRCITHLEKYIYGCLQKGITPLPICSFRKNAIIVCDDIFCGIVPMDPLERKWREQTGLYLREITKYSKHVTRIFCGFEEVLK